MCSFVVSIWYLSPATPYGQAGELQKTSHNWHILWHSQPHPHTAWLEEEAKFLAYTGDPGVINKVQSQVNALGQVTAFL
jgi:hypothetical protein